MTTRSLCLVTLLVVAPLAAHAQTPPDQVVLTNGGMVRGTIIENLPGDHVTIQLPSGETRRFAAAEVQSAGPAAATAPVMGSPTTQPQLPPAPPQYNQPMGYGQPQMQMQPSVTLHVRSSQPRVTLQQLTGSAAVTYWTGRGIGTGIIESYAPICTAPCDIRVPAGTYTLGLSQGEGHAQRADHSMYTFQQEAGLNLDYQSREGLRIAGWIIFSAATIGYLVAALAPIDDPNYLTIFLGATIGYCVAMIPSFILIFLRDHADIQQINPDGSIAL